jgi:hypothetical protein
MKLPFDLGVKLFFRLLLPGFLLSIGASPIIFTLVDWFNQSFSPSISYEIAFVVTIMLMGWLLVVLDMPIYMLFEGRRFWPKFLREFFCLREKARLKRVDEDISQRHIDYNRYLEASVEKRYFPIDENGSYDAIYPSRFGNLLAAFETYPDRRYGMDGVFFWNRIWFKLDKDTREEIDGRQALADSTLYASFALFFIGLLCLLYMGISLYSSIKYVPSPIMSIILSFICIVSGHRVYRWSLYTHAQFGEMIKAMFDVYNSKLNQEISDIIEEIIYFTNDESLRDLQRRERYSIVWIYLNYYLVRCQKCKKFLPPPVVKQHYAEYHGGMDDKY